MALWLLQTRHVLILVVLFFIHLSIAIPQVRAVRKIHLVVRPPILYFWLSRPCVHRPLCLSCNLSGKPWCYWSISTVCKLSSGYVDYGYYHRHLRRIHQGFRFLQNFITVASFWLRTLLSAIALTSLVLASARSTVSLEIVVVSDTIYSLSVIVVFARLAMA